MSTRPPNMLATPVVHGAWVWIEVFDGHKLDTIARYDGNAVGLWSATF
jgi:hypothetical protein